jgi:hypothetical protein
MCELFQSAQQAASNQGASQYSPETRIADAFRRELGVHINPQALRIFIRKEWSTISKAAHEIHDAK